MKFLEISQSKVYYNSFKYDSKGPLREFINAGKVIALVLKVERAIAGGAIIVLGGDGTFLKAIKDSHILGLPYLGVNFGTKGFLLHSLKEIDNNFEFIIKEYPLVECTIESNGKLFTEFAFNEIDFRANTGKIIDLDIMVENFSEAKASTTENNIISTNLKGDGFVFSTPAGSTGYNFSLGGPIVPHSEKVFLLTPKAPWLPRGFRTVILKDTKKTIIKNVGRLSDIKIICDGKDFFEIRDEQITVTLSKSKESIQVLIPKDQKISWEDKILLEQGFTINNLV